MCMHEHPFMDGCSAAWPGNPMVEKVLQHHAASMIECAAAVTQQGTYLGLVPRVCRCYFVMLHTYQQEQVQVGCTSAAAVIAAVTPRG
jgi:hypothetical protein